MTTLDDIAALMGASELMNDDDDEDEVPECVWAGQDFGWSKHIRL